MSTVGIRDLKLRASEIVRRVREDHESVEITYRGRVVARLIPVDSEPLGDPWADLEALRREIAARVPKDAPTIDAISDIRRDL
jgi:prevent-host-death family protein